MQHKGRPPNRAPSRREILAAVAASGLTASCVSTGSSATAPAAHEGNAMTVIIDVHTHPTLKAWERGYDQAGLPRENGRPVQERIHLPDWNPGVSIDAMDRHGIQAMLLSNPVGCRIVRGGAARDLARAMNEEMAGIVAAHPDRFGAFAVLPLDDFDASVEEAIYAIDTLRLEGVCLPTNQEGVYFDDERFAALFAELESRRSVAFVHPVAPAFFGDVRLPYGPSVMEYMFDSTRMLVSLVYSGMRRRYPNFSLISTHGGGAMPYIANRLSTTAGTIGVGHGRTMSIEEVWDGLTSFHFDVTSASAPTALGSLLELVPSSRLMFGTDFPIRPERFIAYAMGQVAESPLLNEAQTRDIHCGTAFTLFPRLAEAIAAR